MALEALRQEVGPETFGDILRTWAADNAYANASIDDFIALAESESAMNLDALFEEWLFEPGKPAGPSGC
jgi:aminopeptidase N